MNSQKKKSKRGKILKIILLIFILLILVIFFGINGYVEGIIKDKIDTQLNEKPGSLYHISYEDLDLNILTGSVSIKKIAFVPTDSAIQLVDSGIIRNIIQTHVELFKIKRVKIFDFISDKNVDISKVIVKNTTTEYLMNPDAVPKATHREKLEKKEKASSDKLFPNIINRVNIGDFEFINATFLISNVGQPDEYLFEIDSLSVVVKDVYVDSSTVVNSIPLNFSDININTKHFALKSMKYYSISTSGIGFNVQDTILTLNQFKLIPKYSREEFNQQIKYNDDLFSISAEKVILNGLNLNEIEKREYIHLNSIVVNNPEIEIYRDKRLPDAPFKYKPLIAGVLKKIPVSVIVDTIQVREGKLSYEEQVELSDKPGKVYFDPFYLSAYNITNHPEQIKLNPTLAIDFNGNIMAQSILEATLAIDLSSLREEFSIQGKLKPVSGAAFNPMVENLMLVKIHTGDVHHAAFKFKATDDLSEGELNLDYENLKVEVLKAKNPDRKSGGLSFLANEVVHTKNLKESKKYRTGTIYFKRRKDRFIVNYLWNSVKTGLISIVAPIADKASKEKKKDQKTEDQEQKKKKGKEGKK